MVSLIEEREKMAKQNVVVSDTTSGINMAIKVAMSPAAQKPPVAPGGYITISRTKVLEINVESMRASSPTHLKSTPSFSDDQIFHHPSALKMFEQITNASKGKQIVMFLDYDGTLSPIVDDPDRAFMSDAMRATVRKLARYFPTAIVTGRCRDKVYSFVQLAELYYAGSHGMDIKGPSKGSKYKNDARAVLFQPASEFLPMIDEVYKALLEKTKSTPGAKVEHNKFCLSVHFRCVDEKKWSELAQQVRSVLKGYPNLRLNQGRKVLEIRPTIKWDKGKALEFLLEALGFGNCTDVFPVYIGDDRTDEDAFKVLRERGQGSGILVSKIPKDTHASYYLQEPAEVMHFLQRLVTWKRVSLRRPLKQIKGSTLIEKYVMVVGGKNNKYGRRSNKQLLGLGDNYPTNNNNNNNNSKDCVQAKRPCDRVHLVTS
ncbi:probable trehalose-phosphate phosphatase J [Diospyros lotus]|uniref:probable trehalose-phosphate phosphatase J n=1 Tax=Diospyros lotus TaxID=55363 RepID=UPI002258F07B|nr:probable trehalose-phosphate phosphatase J [Diospyros lotus]